MPSAPSALQPLIVSHIRQRGPITAAEYIELALYHPEHGYYASAPRRSGADGDFCTSVDAGPLFGAMIAVQLQEMWERLRDRGASHFDLVEAGAGDGRLAAAILDAAAEHHPDLYSHARVTLVERSADARRRHEQVLRRHASRYGGSRSDLPDRITGVVLANELLDAFPVHVVVGRSQGLREIYVGERGGTLVEMDGPLTPEVAGYVARESITLRAGARAEVGLGASAWVEDAAARLASGYLLLFDYGLSAAELYSEARAHGTLTTHRQHTTGMQSWLAQPGMLDITAHVNLTAVADAAVAAGLTPAGSSDQTYFLLNLGIAERLPAVNGAAALADRLSAKTLLLPGGLGSTVKVLAFSRGVTREVLRGFRAPRLT